MTKQLSECLNEGQVRGRVAQERVTSGFFYRMEEDIACEEGNWQNTTRGGVGWGGVGTGVSQSSGEV